MADQARGIRTVLITGAAQGLGLQMARDFLSANSQVVLSDLQDELLQQIHTELAAEYGSDRVTSTPADVTSDSSVGSLLAHVESWSGSLDVLINNAGRISRSPTQDLETSVWERDVDVNLGGTLRCSRAAYPLLSSSADACVINLGSLGSSLGMPMRAGYNAAKTAVLGLTRTLAAEWGPSGIRVNAIAPGFIETAMMRSGISDGRLDEQLMTDRIPLRRLGKPEEISGVATFLASPQASYINGCCIPIDGGTTIDGTFF